jgi:hypothetical protein
VEVGKQSDVWVPLESERLMPLGPVSTAVDSVQVDPDHRATEARSSIDQATAELRVLYSKSIRRKRFPEMLSNPRVESA